MLIAKERFILRTKEETKKKLNESLMIRMIYKLITDKTLVNLNMCQNDVVWVKIWWV